MEIKENQEQNKNIFEFSQSQQGGIELILKNLLIFPFPTK